MTEVLPAGALTMSLEDYLETRHARRGSGGGRRADACAMEHNLSAMGMDHTARLFEFLQVCPARRELLGTLGTCGAVQASPTVGCRGIGAP